MIFQCVEGLGPAAHRLLDQPMYFNDYTYRLSWDVSCLKFQFEIWRIHSSWRNHEYLFQSKQVSEYNQEIHVPQSHTEYQDTPPLDLATLQTPITTTQLAI